MDFADDYSSGESAQSETKEMYLGEGGRKFSLADHGYTVMDRIGEGAYGVVYSAKDNRSGRLVAIKKIEGALDRVSACKRTYRELKLLSLLKHENLIPLRHILSNDVSPNETKNSTEAKSTEIYAIFDLMETDLTTIIKSPQHLTSEHCQFFLYQVLRGLLFMHTAGVIHRDLKPRNVLVNSNCDLRICDFGLARLQVDGPSDARHMTDYVATRWYRAPEIIVGAGTYDKAIDMFSVGCILAELLLRKPIFPGADQYDMLKRLCEVLGPPPDHMIRNAKSAKMHSYLKSLAYQYPKPLYPLRNIFRGCSSKALDLMSRLLTWDPAQRLTVQEALRHPYLAKLYCPEDEPISKPLDAHEFAFEHDRSLVVPDFKRMVQVQINAYAAANKVAPTQIEIVDKRPLSGAPAPAPVPMAKHKNQTAIPGALRAGDAAGHQQSRHQHHSTSTSTSNNSTSNNNNRSGKWQQRGAEDVPPQFDEEVGGVQRVSSGEAGFYDDAEAAGAGEAAATLGGDDDGEEEEEGKEADQDEGQGGFVEESKGCDGEAGAATRGSKLRGAGSSSGGSHNSLISKLQRVKLAARSVFSGSSSSTAVHHAKAPSPSRLQKSPKGVPVLPAHQRRSRPFARDR